MINNDFERIQYDYYKNTSSYVKMILDVLPENEVSLEKKQIIRELYNYLLSDFTKDQIKEMIVVTGLFREKIAPSELEVIAKDIYTKFLNKIIFNSVNRAKIFDIMNEYVKLLVGYYSEFQINEQFSWNTREVEGSYTR